MTRTHRPTAVMLTLLLSVIATLSAGCAPAAFRDGVPWTVQRHRTADARFRRIDGMPFLRIDGYLLDRLTTIGNERANSDAQSELNSILDACHRLAVKAAGDEIDRLPEPAIDGLWERHFQGLENAGDKRSAVRSRYLNQLRDDFDAYLARNVLADSEENARRIARSIASRVGPSVKDQHGSGPLLETVASRYSRPEPGRGAAISNVDVYAPGSIDATTLVSAGLAQNEAESLVRFAPVLVQERHAESKYPKRVDEIGMVALDGVPGRIIVNVDTSEPTLYAYVHKAIIAEREHLQLVYCWWFPEHPAMSAGDPEAGKVDGATIRMTLDSKGRPAIVETIQNCGCHIRCFARSDVEALARSSSSASVTSQSYALEKPEGERPRLDVTGLFDTPKSEEVGHILIVSRGGYHDVVAVESPDAASPTGRHVQSERTYALAPYDELEHLPTRFGRASMFGPDGLVHNAGRLEGWLLAPTGMRSAGQPRQRGTQLVCWDALDFDDPHLLEKTLRLPSDF